MYIPYTVKELTCLCMQFLSYTVLNLEFYGLDSYPVIGTKNPREFTAGASSYRNQSLQRLENDRALCLGKNFESFTEEEKLSLSIKNKISPEEVEEKIVSFELDSKPLCEVLYDNLIDYLQFYRIRQNIVKLGV